MTRGHLAVVEAYDGLVEFVAVDPAERLAARGLGLPLDELAERLECRVTVLGWDDWLRYEATRRSFFGWMPWPATRPIRLPPLPSPARWASPRVTNRPIAARDPGSGLPLGAAALSPPAQGLLADSDPLFLVSWCLARELAELFRADAFDAVLLPMWGGLGYVAQLARATGLPDALDVPFGVVVTGASRARHAANQEGAWTRPAITRRQMEDLSLALADLALTYGPGGDALARAGRLPESAPPVAAPRRRDARMLDALAAAAEAGPAPPAVQFLVHEPLDAASGALVTLDAVRQLRNAGLELDRPVAGAGPDMVFAPQKPRSFVEYWGSRGWVRELTTDGVWRFRSDRPPADGALCVRVYPSAFEHLPDAGSELARGSLVLLSNAAAEGLAPGAELPAETQLGEPDPARVAGALARVLAMSPGERDEIRRTACRRVAAAQRGPAREERLERAARSLRALLDRRVPRPDLGRVALALLDRRQSLRAVVTASDAGPPRVTRAGTGGLTVVVPCYEAGPLLAETVESIWASERVPEEVLLVDDGSRGDETLDTIAALERAAAARGLPLRIVRQTNGGLAAARNAGLAEARGEFISFLDADDVIEPVFYRVAVALLARHRALGGVAAWAVCFGAGVPDGFWNAPQAEFPLLLVENTVFVPTVVRTDTLRALGGYDARQRYNYEDWELSVRMLAAGLPIVTLPAYLQRYRVRAGSLLRTMSDAQNQHMRELMLARHGEVVCRFAMEVAMQIEHRLAKIRYAPAPVAARRSAARRVLGRVRRVLARVAA
jgi:hypothetical protein